MNKSIYYLYGVYLGDGSVVLKRVNKDKSEYYSGCFVLKQGLMYDSIMFLLRSLDPDISVSEIRKDSNKGGPWVQISFNSQLVCRHIKDVCGLSGSKHLPVVSTREQMENLVSGLLDTDGSISRRGYTVEFLNTDERLILEFKKLLENWNISYTEGVTKHNETFIYRVHVRNENLYKLPLNLQVSYKRVQYEELQRISYAHCQVRVDYSFIQRNYNLLKMLMPKSSFYKLVNGQRTTISKSVYDRCK